MAASALALITVLAEDRRQANFARRYLRRLGCSDGRIREKITPRHAGAGDAYVRGQYPDEVAEYRRARSRRSSALVVCIDADTVTVRERLRQFSDALPQDRTRGERIVLLVPRRNIETWILCLAGRGVDEETDYKATRDVQDNMLRAAEELHRWSRPGAAIPGHCVPSLRRVIEEPELTRLER